MIRHGEVGCLKRGGWRPSREGELNQYGPWLKVPQRQTGEGRWGAGGHSTTTPPQHGGAEI